MGKHGAVSVVAVAALLVTCGGSDLPDVGTDPSQVILRVEQVGGFAPLEFTLGQGPVYTVTGDRQLIFLGPQQASFPGPLLPNYQTTLLTEDELEQLLVAVVETGLPTFESKIDDSAASFVADASTTVVTFTDSEGAHRFSVYALGIGEFSDPDVQALADLIVLLDQLASGGFPSRYETDQVQVIARQGRPEDPDLSTVRPWPVTPDPAAFGEIAEGIGCMAFEGVAGTTLLDAFAESDALTFFAVDGTTYRVLARQLLPGEVGCVLAGS